MHEAHHPCRDRRPLPEARRPMSGKALCEPCGPRRLLLASLAAAALVVGLVQASAQDALPDRTVLPIAPPPFAEVAAKTLEGSRPSWPAPLRALRARRTSCSSWSTMPASATPLRSAARRDADADELGRRACATTSST